MDLITHFSHAHKLALGYSPEKGHQICKICGTTVSILPLYMPVYTCIKKSCVYSVHRLCAEIPEKTIHPFHPHHTLVFCSSSEVDGKYESFSSRKCSFCGHIIPPNQYNYYCQDCHFVLDLQCAVLKPIQPKPPLNMNSITHGHQHPVLECIKPDFLLFSYYCQVCGEKHEDYDNVFVCIECKSLMHEICASLPDEIIHPFHLQHPLTLHTAEGIDRRNICNACSGRDIMGNVYTWFPHKVYRCCSCSFSLDVQCASLKPTEGLKMIVTPSHPHPFILCDMIKNFRRKCFGCQIGFEGFIYVCLDCSILLNKSCIDLPADIIHPFHPQHYSLQLEIKGRWSSEECRGCCNQLSPLSYICGVCDFSLDLKCAAKSFEFVKMKVHEHLLAYFDFEAAGNVCHMKCRSKCTKYFFRCIELGCKFSIHDHCCPSLPHAIKHPCHFHKLTFTREVVQDVPGEDLCGEFYCHACEELREIDHPTYYCAECPFIAHVHCVISEIVAYFEAEIPVPIFSKPSIEEHRDLCNVIEWKHETEETSHRGQIPDEEHRRKDEIHHHNEEHVEQQSKEEDDDDGIYLSFHLQTDDSDHPKEDENNFKAAAYKERMLQNIDEQINSLKADIAYKERMLQDIDEQINSLKVNLANLLERRGHIGAANEINQEIFHR